MSLSPTTESPTHSEDYASGWVAIFKMLREGGSWSGRERNCCFLNTGELPFADVSAVSGLDYADDGRGLAVVDWDRDGALDLWTSSRTGPRVRFLRNTKTANHFLAVRLEGRSCNRDAIGAYRAAMALEPDDPTLRYNLGLAYIRTGNHRAAITQYEALKSLNADQADVLLSKIRKRHGE